MISFNNTSEFNGLVQLYESEIGVDYGVVSGNPIKLKEFTARCNLALDRYFAIAVQAAGTWELDDSGHTSDYAEIYTNLVSGIRDYSFITDANGNAILDIYKVLILPTSTSTIYQELDPVDENQSENIALIDESNVSGAPTRYAKRANAIHFDAIPNYSVSKGIKILINRESSHFISADTMKTPGYSYHQEYFFLKPAFDYARIHTLDSLPRLEAEMLKLEGDLATGRIGLIAKAYGNRRKDEMQSFSGETINSV